LRHKQLCRSPRRHRPESRDAMKVGDSHGRGGDPLLANSTTAGHRVPPSDAAVAASGTGASVVCHTKMTRRASVSGRRSQPAHRGPSATRRLTGPVDGYGDERPRAEISVNWLLHADQCRRAAAVTRKEAVVEVRSSPSRKTTGSAAQQPVRVGVAVKKLRDDLTIPVVHAVATARTAAAPPNMRAITVAAL
jgi:hypothetical protein